MNPLSLDALRELAPAYVMQILTDEERAQFESALQDPALAAALAPEIEAHRAAMEHIATGLAATPPRGLRNKLIERIAMERDESLRLTETAEVIVPQPVPVAPPAPVESSVAMEGPRAVRVRPIAPPRAAPSRGRGGAAWATAGALGLAFAATLFFALNLRSRVDTLEGEIAAQERLIRQTGSRLASRDSTIDALALGAEDLTRVRLITNEAAGPSLQVYWNRGSGRAVIYATGLAQLAADRAYCLWLIRDGKPEAVTMFSPDAGGRSLLNAVAVSGNASSVAGFAVTEEPAGGSPKPTMTPFLVGTVPAATAPQ